MPVFFAVTFACGSKAAAGPACRVCAVPFLIKKQLFSAAWVVVGSSLSQHAVYVACYCYGHAPESVCAASYRVHKRAAACQHRRSILHVAATTQPVAKHCSRVATSWVSCTLHLEAGICKRRFWCACWHVNRLLVHDVLKSATQLGDASAALLDP